MYTAPKERTAKLRNFLANFRYEYNKVPQEQSDYQLTQSGYLKKIEEHRLKVLNNFRGQAANLRDHFEGLKKEIESKEKTIFFPESNSWDEKRQALALSKRQLALTRISSGNIQKDAFIQEIADNFKRGEIDTLGEYYNYLVSSQNPNIPLDTSLALIGKLKECFRARGLDELKTMKEDLSQGQSDLSEIKKTFQLG